MSIRVILSTGQGQGQVTKCHERSPNSKILFRACGTCSLGTFARRIKKSKPFCNITPKKVNDREWSGQPLVTKGQVFKLAFLNKKKCVSEPFCSQDSKNGIFITIRCLEMLQITVWKSDVVNEYGYLAICLPEIGISAWNWACYMPRYASTIFYTFFWKLWKFCIWKIVV